MFTGDNVIYQETRMRTHFLLTIFLCTSAFAQTEFEDQISREYPGAVTVTETYSPSEISHSTKRVPRPERHVKINRDLVLQKMMQRMNDQQQDIENLKRRVQFNHP